MLLMRCSRAVADRDDMVRSLLSRGLAVVSLSLL